MLQLILKIVLSLCDELQTLVPEEGQRILNIICTLLTFLKDGDE